MPNALVFIPQDWYWLIGGDETQVYASARATMVPASDQTYQTWLAAGGDTTRIASMDELIAVLSNANVAPYLTVTPRQARLALLAAGLLDQVEAAVKTAGGATQITWEYATAINRADPFIASIGTSLHLTDAQIDALFTQAAAL